MPAKLPKIYQLERLPWHIRAVLGAGVAAFAVGITYAIPPLRGFPLLLAFPTVILASWFLGMAGGISCAIVDAILVDAFLTQAQFHFSKGYAQEGVRLSVFLVTSTFVGWSIGRLAEQRTRSSNQELQQRLLLADAERKLAEERAQSAVALRERDEALQIALSANGMGLWIWDIHQGSIYWSEEVYRTIGVAPGEIPATADAYFKWLHPEDGPLVREEFLQALRHGTEYQKEYRVIFPDGSLHWLASKGRCQRNEKGESLRMMGVIYDITLRKQTEEAMLQSEKLALAGRLAATVAHEINNPLEAMANLLYLTSVSSDLETARSHAASALDELMRVSHITQATLKFHRQPGAPKPVLLSEIVSSVLRLLRGRLLSSEIHAEMRAESEAAVFCMPGEVQQVFSNIVINAAEAISGPGALVVRIRRSRDWRNSAVEGVRVTFLDTGAGMSRATMRRLSEAFFTTKTDKGTGLGMWVVAQLMERNYGHVRVWSSRLPHLHGTAISLFLPAVPEALPQDREGELALRESFD